MLFITFITLSFLFLLMKHTRKDKNSKRLPPGPKRIPIIGNFHQLGKLPHRSLQNLSKTYGDLMFLQLGFVPTIVVSSPDRARQIFKNHDLVFSGRPPLYAIKKLSYNFSSLSVAPYGEYWREIRKIVILELMTVKRVQSFGKKRAEEVSVMVGRIATSCSSANNIPVDCLTTLLVVWLLVREMTLLIAKRVADLRGSCMRCSTWWLSSMWLINFQGWVGLTGLTGWTRGWTGFSTNPMRPKSDHDEDIIDVLLRIIQNHKDPNYQGITLNNERLKGVLLDIFVAGTDTSATTITWTMAELIRNPTAKEKAQQEVRKVAKGKTKVEETDLPKLTYLKLVIKESLKLHPPSPLLVPRETTENCTIDNKYDIPAKTRIIFNAAAMSTDPGSWESPERFWPERFMDTEVDFRGQHFELLPFGAGRRVCPGINFAIPLVELALAHLLFCFDWELPEEMSTEDIDMEEAIGITMHKKTPLCLVASPVK